VLKISLFNNVGSGTRHSSSVPQAVRPLREESVQKVFSVSLMNLFSINFLPRLCNCLFTNLALRRRRCVCCYERPARVYLGTGPWLNWSYSFRGEHFVERNIEFFVPPSARARSTSVALNYHALPQVYPPKMPAKEVRLESKPEEFIDEKGQVHFVVIDCLPNSYHHLMYSGSLAVGGGDGPRGEA
jgi:hypothetical protein